MLHKHKKTIEEQERVISEKQALLSDLEEKIKNNEVLMEELQDKVGTLEDSKKILLKQIEYKHGNNANDTPKGRAENRRFVIVVSSNNN